MQSMLWHCFIHAENYMKFTLSFVFTQLQPHIEYSEIDHTSTKELLEDSKTDDYIAAYIYSSVINIISLQDSLTFSVKATRHTRS